ncbi:MAG: aldehyde dehydrogenase family protein [Paraburkholderia tropica]|uniref:Succinate semialdehyde dehydrogenase n=1 Tax=Paraburkholderia tropica TaxID=92647 RepID=A0ABX5MSQ3_9BURK|nr:aldehyde dehydrogenase family protein [Paraburkholderia tropica]MBB3002396.1 succinate-semialdehyde dehydrogenase [Paraburkholderia tropica]MBB6321784.1 succinate-semialdehyde dehydrogenase [Paraburkholderia tropica]MDE1140289.1 aldehyde dehydrogenase family protein [Paraburkholderia tropica]PXX18218.1 succinate semialdehyde dehydrogenase [Paraburkholderia tropica]PZW86200.1 succinate semialdehyde dehydrogenase [Paraburkholderia tropica]
MAEATRTEHAVSLNPATGEVIARHAFDNREAVEAALVRTAAAARVWRDTPVAQRANVLVQLARVLRERKTEFALMMADEMGKPVAQARGEVEKCAALCEWYAENGPAMLAPTSVPVLQGTARQEFRPLGPILAVMPWNFPIWQVLRGAVSMLLAGNTYVLKHAPNVMGSAYLLRDALAATDLPAGAFEVLNLPPEDVAPVIADTRIAAVAVTGSVRAGAAIAQLAGAALKKCVLELGGSDAFIVLADADLDDAVRSAVLGRFGNTGQVCLAAKRLIVEAPVAAEFEARFVAAVKALRMGSPRDEANFIGPMARYDLRDELHGQVERTLAEGARLVLGGHKVEGPGNYYEPTVIADVQPGMTSFREELFGPVASIIVARDAQHAVEMANDSEFGLGGTIWTRDLERADAMAAQIETGAVFINGDVATDPRVTVGGVKKSGFGRELSSFGMHEFCNVQTVWTDRR